MSYYPRRPSSGTLPKHVVFLPYACAKATCYRAHPRLDITVDLVRYAGGLLEYGSQLPLCFWWLGGIRLDIKL